MSRGPLGLTGLLDGYHQARSVGFIDKNAGFLTEVKKRIIDGNRRSRRADFISSGVFKKAPINLSCEYVLDSRWNEFDDILEKFKRVGALKDRANRD